MRPALRVLLLAALVATAGCSGVFGGESESGPGTTTTDRDPFPPGLTEDGLVDANALADAHAGSLDNESLTLQERRVQRYANGTLRWRQNRTVRAAPNRSRYLMITDVIGRPMLGDDEGRAEVFADGDRVYRRVRTPNGSWADLLRTASGDPAAPRGVPVDPTKSGGIYVLLNAFAVNDSGNVDRLTADGRRYRLRSSSLEQPGLLASHLELDAVRNATLEVVVTSDGFVEEYRIAFEGTHDGAVVRGERTVWYPPVGTTTVEAPAWVDEVEDRNGTGEDGEEKSETTNEEETTQAS